MSRRGSKSSAERGHSTLTVEAEKGNASPSERKHEKGRSTAQAPAAPSATPALDAALAATGNRMPEVVEVDGRRIVIEGKDEIVLQCGESSITLRRNGRIVIKGLYVETHATGTNRIKGGSVKIN